MIEVGHTLWQVGYFTHVTARYENGLPVREPLERPYFRYYCTCGAVGGKTSTREASLDKFIAHEKERSND